MCRVLALFLFLTHYHCVCVFAMCGLCTWHGTCVETRGLHGVGSLVSTFTRIPSKGYRFPLQLSLPRVSLLAPSFNYYQQ